MAGEKNGVMEIQTSELEKNQVCRSSTGKLKAATKGDAKGPNYLRASTGSCHDICKYGTPNIPRSEPFRRVKRRSIPKAEIPVEIFVPSVKKNMKMDEPSSPVIDVSESPRLEDVVLAKHPSLRAPKPRSPVLDVLESTKQKNVVFGKRHSICGPIVPRQQAQSSMKVRPTHASKPTSQGAQVHMKVSSVKRKPASDMQSLSLDSSNTVKQESSSKVKVPPSKGHLTNPPKPIRPDVQSLRKSPLSEASRSVMQNTSTRMRSSSHLISGPICKTSPLGKKSSLLGASKSGGREGISSDDKAPSKPALLDGKRMSTSTKVGGLKSKSSNGGIEQSSPPNLSGRTTGRRLSGKISTGTKTDSGAITSTASLSLKARMNPKTAVKNTPTSSTIALTPNLPGTKVPSLNVKKKTLQKEQCKKPEATSDDLNGYADSKKPNSEKVPEKTLHMIEAETDTQSPASAHKGSKSIQYQLPFSPESLASVCQSNSPFSSQDAVETTTESEYTSSEVDEPMSYDGTDPAKTEAGQSTGTSRKSRVLEGNDSAPVKLKFRRGKVIDPQIETDNLRMLRFRRTRASGVDQGATKERRRSFKEGRDVGPRPDTVNPDSSKVILRHQDVQEKKCDQGLLNNVIEETASKLVETRKSKVKALVGAFETVISLQESKSTADKSSSQSSPERGLLISNKSPEYTDPDLAMFDS